MQRIAYFLQVGLLVYILFGLWLYFNQRNELYHPNTTKVMPKDLPGFETRYVRTDDNLTLTAWMHPGSPLLLYFQGNSGNSADRLEEIQPYVDNGWGVLLVPYRGYGGNPGEPTEKHLYEDAEATLKLVHNVAPECTVLMGRSMGSGVATYIARKYKAASLILQSPFTSVADVAAYYYPIYPVEFLLSDKFDNYGRIHLINMPLLIMHGTEDTTVPYMQGTELYEHALQPKKIITFHGNDHNDMPSKEVAQDVFNFTETYLKRCKEK